MGRKGSLLGKGLMAALGYSAVNAILMGAREAQVMEEMEKHQGENNMMHSNMLLKNEINIDSRTNNAFISCFSSGAVINVEEPDSKELYIDLFALCGKVTIRLPKGAKIEYLGKGQAERISDKRKAEEVESRYTVRIKRNDMLASLIIENV